MKKLIVCLIVLIIVLGGISLLKEFNYKNNNENNVIKDNIETDLLPSENKYIDNNPIQIGLYKYYKRGVKRELITEYTENWNYHKDISSFEVFFTKEEKINGNIFQDTFKEYFEKYENITNYKIGYEISFKTFEKEIHKTILSPKDTEEFYEYLEIYLYDDYHREKGVWYSHTTEEEYNEETLLTSIKITSGIKIEEITSDIVVTAFTYDYDDFDEEGFYKGISKYKIIVKKANKN